MRERRRGNSPGKPGVAVVERHREQPTQAEKGHSRKAPRGMPVGKLDGGLPDRLATWEAELRGILWSYSKIVETLGDSNQIWGGYVR